ncbi:MAG TPA: hypothetical protein VJS69_03290, partial [Candidatus Krumholzibacteria bacterium]|nr:hypothetical protein [Candidatus Krumholzibacteria bacterium]
MSNRIDTLEATLAMLKRLEKKGVRSVYLDGVEIPNGAASAAPAAASAFEPARATPPPSPVAATPRPASASVVAPASAATVAKLAELAQTVSVCT